MRTSDIERRRIWASNYRAENRGKYNEYCNRWYHEHKEQQREYKREWKLRKVQKAKEEGVLNAWAYVNEGKPPKYTKEETNENIQD